MRTLVWPSGNKMAFRREEFLGLTRLVLLESLSPPTPEPPKDEDQIEKYKITLPVKKGRKGEEVGEIDIKITDPQWEMLCRQEKKEEKK